MAILDHWYPVNIRESRYNGTYSGGTFIITAGADHPEKLDAFGSDTECMRFWHNHAENGPIMQIETAISDRGVYVESGDDPTELLDAMLAHFDGPE